MFARFAGVCCLLISGIALLGWLLGVDFLKNPFADQVTMKTNAALCYILGGLALLSRRRWSIIFASCILVVSGLTLLEYLFDLDLGLDQILVHEPSGAFGTVHANRMAPPTAVGFVLLSPALMLIALRRALLTAQSLAIGAGAIATAALVGIVYEVPALQGPAGLTRIAPLSALAMLIMTVGILFAFPDRGMMACLTADTAGGQMARRLLPLALLPVVTGVLSQAGRRAGLLDSQVQSALDALVGSYLLAGFIWASAASLHRIDTRRLEAEKALRESLGSLEHRVAERTAELSTANAAMNAEILDRIKAEAELRRSERRFRSLAEATAAIVWHTTPAGEVDAEHPTWTAFTGQTFAEYKGWGWLEAIHPDDREQTVQRWKQALASGRLYEEEHRLRDREGRYRDMSIRGVPLRGDDGAIHEWVGLHYEVTAQKQSEAEVRLLSRLVSLAHDAILIIQPGGRISYWNHGAERLYGWSKEQSLGQISHELLKTRFPKPLTEIEGQLVPKQA
jgi:PAS domain S-box-containing protein